MATTAERPAERTEKQQWNLRLRKDNISWVKDIAKDRDEKEGEFLDWLIDVARGIAPKQKRMPEGMSKLFSPAQGDPGSNQAA